MVSGQVLELLLYYKKKKKRRNSLMCTKIWVKSFKLETPCKDKNTLKKY